MRYRSGQLVISVLFTLGLSAGCGASDPRNGTLVCSATGQQCPDGYGCVARTNTCWKGGIDLGADAGPTGAEAGVYVDASQVDLMTRMDGGPNDGGSLDAAIPDGPSAETRALDGTGTDAAAFPTDTAPPDQAMSDVSDVPQAPIDTGDGCVSPKIRCSDGACIDPAVGCCVATDCVGACTACGTDHLCAPVKGLDDPTQRCAGSCDSSGACKAKRGQACGANGDCANGICADGYCCDRACTGTCEACDVASAQGTCKTLAAGDKPRASRTPCAGTAPCVGTCNGSSADCAYSTGACGAASCSTAGYQAAGNCSQGACQVPSVLACQFACDANQGGCTGVCQPTARQCSGGGVPQLCSAAGAWQDQPACQGLAVCDSPSGTCVCQVPNTTCGASCVNLDADPKNCGTCNHDCQGGTCSAGQCQPIPLTVNLSASVRLFGQDASNLYYSLPSPTQVQGNDAYRVSKTASSATGTVVYTNPSSLSGIEAIVGATVFIYDGAGKMSSYTIGQSTQAGPTGVADYGIPFFKVTSALPRYYAQYASDTSTNLTIQWFDPVTNAAKGSFSHPLNAPTSVWSASFGDYSIGGDTVYWQRMYYDMNYNALAGSGYFSASPNATSAKQLAGGTSLTGLSIVDVNDVSLLLVRYPDSYLFRIPLPAGKGTGDPDSLISIADGGRAVEDAKGVYWIAGDDGNLYRCAPANCYATKTKLATGVGPASALLQDASALYWVPSSTNRIYKLAK